MKNLIWGIALVFLLAVPFSRPLYAQDAAKLEALLETPALSWEQTAAFVLEAASAEPSFDYAAGQKWLPKNVSPGDTARLGGVALLLMRSFDVKGGMFYSMMKSPHHAYRELVYKRVISGNADPGMPVSGRQLILMVNRLLAMTEKAGVSE